MFFGLEYYFLYNLLIGPFFAFHYYRTEGRIIETKEFLRLLLLPVVGYGYWLYERELRANRIPEFPRKWFVWKKMIPINWGFIITLAALGFAVFVWLILEFQKSSTGMSHGNFYSEIAGMFVEFGVVLLFSAIIGSYLTSLGLLIFLLIFLPNRFSKSVEAETYKRKYLEERQRNQSVL